MSGRANRGHDDVIDRTAPVVTITEVAGCAVISIHGEVAGWAANQLRQRLVDEIGRRPRGRVVLDMTGVGFLNSEGLAALLEAQRVTTLGGGDIRLVCPGHATRRPLCATGLDHVLPTATSLTEAVRSMSALEETRLAG